MTEQALDLIIVTWSSKESDVYVHGKYFPESLLLFCVFSPAFFAPADWLIPTLWFAFLLSKSCSYSNSHCFFPPKQIRLLRLKVGLNIEPTRIFSISPTLAPTTGGTHVLLTGNNFVATEVNTCIFSSESGDSGSLCY